MALKLSLCFLVLSMMTLVIGAIPLERSVEESSEESRSRESRESEESEERLLGLEIPEMPLRNRRDTPALLDEPEYVYAKAEIFPNRALPREQRKVKGTVMIRQRKSSQGVYRETEFRVELRGLLPSSLHGFHVHEFGTIGASCSQSGSHYNPFGNVHGSPAAQDNRHVGDLGNVITEENGTVSLAFSDLKAKLYSLTTIVGRAFVIHDGMDDLGVHEDKGSKTTGNAGGRAACGVIVWSDGAAWRGPEP